MKYDLLSKGYWTAGEWASWTEPVDTLLSLENRDD